MFHSEQARAHPVICLTGFIRRAEPIGVIQRGTHRLVDINGNVSAILLSDQVNLYNLEGHFATVCGIDEGLIEGFRSLRAIQVFPLGQLMPPPQLDLRTLLLVRGL